MKIDDDLKRWRREEPLFNELEVYLIESLKPLFRKNGLNVTIQTRVKTELSLYKKLVEKRNRKKYSYNHLKDKLGIRLICKFSDEIPKICEIIDENFDVKKTENKIEDYPPETQGYKGIHKDTKLKPSDKNFRKFKSLFFEIQIRTMCDNVWADIYHDVGYKPERMPNDSIKRELYCLGGVLEIADGCFSKIHQNIGSSSKLTPLFMLNFLSIPFYQIFASSYDIEYSIDNLNYFTPLLNKNSIVTVEDFKNEINSFIEKNWSLLTLISDERREDFLSNPLISQPEVFVIFYLIEKDKYQLQKEWGDQFAEKYLEDLSTWWGDPIIFS